MNDDYHRRIAALSAEQQKLLEVQLKKRGLKALLKDAPAPGGADGSPSSSESLKGVEGSAAKSPSHEARRGMQFSLFFFSDDGSNVNGDKYELLLQAAKLADARGFTAIWTPERHFHQFGGLYPNPSVLGAALAMVTERIQIRAGSIVLPLQHPLRVAEEWSVVDNLSRGRVGVSFAPGWLPNDFVLSTESFARRKEAMYEQVEIVKRLWKGEPVKFSSREAVDVEVKIFPRPVQRELPVWITSAGSRETWVRAGEMGANVLTALLQLTVDEVAENILLYRQALSAHGHDPQAGQVTLMLHTFVSDDLDAVREKVRVPLSNYLRTHLGLYENKMLAASLDIDIDKVTEEDKQALAAFAFERYFNNNGLFGTPETCRPMIERLKSIGVDEVGCLIDFGVEAGMVMASLDYLDRLRELSNPQANAEAGMVRQPSVETDSVGRASE